MRKTHREDIGCLLSCDICNNFKTDVPSKLKIHMEIHSEERPYVCSICSKTFKQFAQMKNHEHCHSTGNNHQSPELPDRWHTPKHCDICGRKYANVKSMKMHRQAVHGNNKPYKCDYCNYACSRKAMLVLHVRTHTGFKPFKCEVCSYSCSDHNSLRRHKMRHSGQKPYKCPHCPYSCIQAISLKVHVKNKHPGMIGIYCCDMCLYRTVNENQYDNHLNDHKNGLIKTEIVKPGNSDQLFVMKNVPGKEGFVLSRADGRFDNIPSQDSVIQVLQAPDIQSSAMQQMIQTSVQQTVPLILDGENVQQLQIQMNEAAENVTDLVRTAPVEALPPNDITAAHLIYTALNAISETSETGSDSIDSQGLVEGVESGTIPTSIETNAMDGDEINCIITFHLPNGEELKREISLQEQPVVKEGISVVQNSGNVSNWPTV